MATSNILHQMTAPTFSAHANVYSYHGTVNERYTIPKTGWYCIQLCGAWNASRIRAFYGTGAGDYVEIALAQVVGINGATVTTEGMYYLEQGTSLNVIITDASGWCEIYDIT